VPLLMAPNIGFVVLPLKQTRGHLSMPRRRRRRPARRPAAARSEQRDGTHLATAPPLHVCL
jgi:hypothetical protein